MGASVDNVVLLLSNYLDETAIFARSVTLRAGTRLDILERLLPAARANAGHARRLAMEAACDLAGPGGIVMTTDADGRVDPDWVAATLSALGYRADVVVGRVELDPLDWDRIPMRLHEDDARECASDTLCDAIRARLDPDPADPCPRYTQHSGASIAVSVEAYRRCGGVPDVASGEDRALTEAIRYVDARVRHAPEVT